MNKLINSLYLWLDTGKIEDLTFNQHNSISWIRCLPFIVIHLACISVVWVGCNYEAVIVCLLSYFIRMFAITAFYHRLFSHRSFKTSRFMQLIFAILGASATQRGPLWWSSHHRNHHKHSDSELDSHSPVRHGFISSHFGWFVNQKNFRTETALISDLLYYPELIFLNRYDFLVPILYAAFLYLLGGWLYVVWGYFISTILLYHATFLINSLAHSYGSQKYDTKDHSRNNWWLALITLGEGWHNNHHYWPSSARQGFKTHEIDITYQLLKILAWFGLIWDLRLPPQDVIHGK